MRSTQAEHARHLPALAKAAHRRAPLGGAASVADSLARVDHMTTDPSGDVSAGELITEDRRSCLLDQPHPLGDSSLRDQGDTLQRQTLHLQVEITALAPSSSGPCTEIARPGSVELAQQRELTLVIVERAVCQRRIGPRLQPPGNGEPSARDAQLTPGQAAVAPEPRGRDGRTHRVATLPEQPKSALIVSV